MSNPYLSIVLVARNDNYGGDFNFRFQNFININCPLLEKLDFKTELIIVNWNFVIENPSLKNAISWPESLKKVRFRIIDVPPEIHNNFNIEVERKKVEVYEFIAKNVGIRRAKGDYILTTNADILLSEKLVPLLNKLNENKYYRANRYDFYPIYEVKINENLIQSNIFRIWLKGFFYNVTGVNKYKLFFYKVLNTLRVKWVLIKANNKFLHNIFNVNHDCAEFNFHANNCGDFILTHKNNYFKLQGFPENTFVSTHTDALFVCMLYLLTNKEIVFPHPIYHQDHERRYSWHNIKQEKELLDAYRGFEEKALSMLNAKSYYIYNKENWGLHQIELNETNF